MRLPFSYGWRCRRRRDADGLISPDGELGGAGCVVIRSGCELNEVVLIGAVVIGSQSDNAALRIDGKQALRVLAEGVAHCAAPIGVNGPGGDAHRIARTGAVAYLVGIEVNVGDVSHRFGNISDLNDKCQSAAFGGGAGPNSDAVGRERLMVQHSHSHSDHAALPINGEHAAGAVAQGVGGGTGGARGDADFRVNRGVLSDDVVRRVDVP